MNEKSEEEVKNTTGSFLVQEESVSVVNEEVDNALMSSGQSLEDRMGIIMASGDEKNVHGDAVKDGTSLVTNGTEEHVATPSATIPPFIPPQDQSFTVDKVVAPIEQPSSSFSSDQNQTEEYHTISGGPKTINELREEDPTRIPPKVPAPTIGRFPQDIIEVPGGSLVAPLFVLFLITTLGLIGLYYSSPSLLPYLVTNEYLSVDASSTYMFSGIALPHIFANGLLELLVQVLVVEGLLIFLAGLIDLGMDKRTQVFAKFFTLFIILFVIGVGLFVAELKGYPIVATVMHAKELLHTYILGISPK